VSGNPLAEYLVKMADRGRSGHGFEVLSAEIVSWSAGNRAIKHHDAPVAGLPSGATATGVAYNAALANTLAPGDTMAVLRQAGTYLVLSKIGTA
jgi:hypothetical protein